MKTYTNVCRLIHEILPDEDIARLSPDQQFLECLGRNIAQCIEEQDRPAVDVHVEWSDEEDCYEISVLDEVILVYDAEDAEEAYELAREDIDLAITRYEMWR